MFYFQKMKSVLKCLSLSLTSLPPSHPLPHSSPFLPRQKATNFLVRSKPL